MNAEKSKSGLTMWTLECSCSNEGGRLKPDARSAALEFEKGSLVNEASQPLGKVKPSNDFANDCSKGWRGYEPYVSGHGLLGNESMGVAGMLLLADENGEEERVQPSMPIYEGERGEEMSSFRLSGKLNIIPLVSRGLSGLSGSERGSQVNDDIGEWWLSKENDSRSNEGEDCEGNEY
jgi:hypothetical protein